MELLHALQNTTARTSCHKSYFADEICPEILDYNIFVLVFFFQIYIW